jgi:hypothetical protein
LLKSLVVRHPVIVLMFSFFLTFFSCSARSDVAFVTEWLRAEQFDLAAAYAAEAPSCSASARNRVVSGLLRAELYSQAFGFILDKKYRTSWSRVTLHDVLAVVGTVQLNELSIADFFTTAISSESKVRKRRNNLLISVLDMFRRSKCAVNDQTTLLLTRAVFAIEGDERAGMPEMFERIESLLAKVDPSPRTANGAPVNCPTMSFLASQARDADELTYIKSIIGSKRVVVGGDLCLALVRASLAVFQSENARRITRDYGLSLSSDMWAQVIAAFDKAGRPTIAMQLLFQQEQSWSLPSRNACTRMLLSLARTQRNDVVRRPPPIPENVGELLRANASSLWTAAIYSPLRYAQERNFRLDHITFQRAIGANFTIGNMGAAFVLWRWYAQTYPQLHGTYLEKSVQLFMTSLGVYHQVGRQVDNYFAPEVVSDVPIVEWRWRAGNAAEQASLQLFCETAAVGLRTKPSAVNNYAQQHLVVQRSDDEPLDFAGAYLRFQKVHHASRRDLHARDNARRHRLHPRRPADEAEPAPVHLSIEACKRA